MNHEAAWMPPTIIGQNLAAVKGRAISALATTAEISVPDLCSDPRTDPAGGGVADYIDPIAKGDYAAR